METDFEIIHAVTRSPCYGCTPNSHKCGTCLDILVPQGINLVIKMGKRLYTAFLLPQNHGLCLCNGSANSYTVYIVLRRQGNLSIGEVATGTAVEVAPMLPALKTVALTPMS
jgi:hypothetical protein